MLPSDQPQAPEWFANLLQLELSAWITLNEHQIRQLHQHYSLLHLWNKKINLTTVKPGAETVVRHYCESLFFGAQLPASSEHLTVADIGSGAGFPGIPLAILKPGWKVTLIEANQRKAVFLGEATRAFDNVSVLAQRAEEVSLQRDWVVSRAVNPEAVLKNVPRLGGKVGLMLGASDFVHIKSRSNIAWGEPIQLPWGDQRICVYGACST